MLDKAVAAAVSNHHVDEVICRVRIRRNGKSNGLAVGKCLLHQAVVENSSRGRSKENEAIEERGNFGVRSVDHDNERDAGPLRNMPEPPNGRFRVGR